MKRDVSASLSVDIVNKLRTDCIREGLDPAEGIVVLLEASIIISRVLRPDINAFDVLRGAIDTIESAEQN